MKNHKPSGLPLAAGNFSRRAASYWTSRAHLDRPLPVAPIAPRLAASLATMPALARLSAIATREAAQ